MKILRRRCRPGSHSGPFSELVPRIRTRPAISFCVACGTVVVPPSETKLLETELSELIR